MTSSPVVFPISGGVQSYDWGKLGKSSKVAQYAANAASPGFNLVDDKPYAELWMGTHSTLPSKVISTSSLLATHLQSKPELLGEKVTKKFNIKDGSLPFLFKVLAIRKALSIQAHPDKALAERLHKERPDLYKDDNHKPEMAIALTDFRALCGFRPFFELSIYLRDITELRSLIPPLILGRFTTFANSSDPQGFAEKHALKDLWSAVMTAPPELVKEELSKLIKRYKEGGAQPSEESVKDLVITVEEQFPGDVGVFCIFLLNVVDLKPGQAIFLGAGEPHAYISGDIVETMATSDNVLRAGLTPKPRDVPNLVESLTYNSSEWSKHAVKPSVFKGSNRGIDDETEYTRIYDPPIPEFSVLRTTLPHKGSETHRAIDGPSVAIVTSGEGTVRWGERNELPVVEGAVFFVGAGTELTILGSGESGLELYRAFVEAE